MLGLAASTYAAIGVRAVQRRYTNAIRVPELLKLIKKSYNDLTDLVGGNLKKRPATELVATCKFHVEKLCERSTGDVAKTSLVAIKACETVIKRPSPIQDSDIEAITVALALLFAAYQVADRDKKAEKV